MRWTDFTPQEAGDLDLSVRLDIEAPLNEEGERCPWPWEPQQLVNVPLGQYHCPYCGAVVLAGLPHLDYGEPVRDLVQCEARNDAGVRCTREAGHSLAHEHRTGWGHITALWPQSAGGEL